MSEEVRMPGSPEERVFGNAFSFRNGAADKEARQNFFAERYATLKTEESGWLPRLLNIDSGVVADLYKARRIAATLVVDNETNLTDIYTTSAGGEFGDTTLRTQISFDEAVIAAEDYALGL